MLDVWVIAPEDLPIPPIRGGSVQIYADSLIRHLSNYSNLSVTLVSPAAISTHTENRLSADGYRHILVSNKHGHYLQNVLRLIRANKPTVVQIENRPKFVHEIRLASPGVKIVLNMHSTTFVHPKRISSKAAIRAFKNADCVVCNSQYLKRRFQSLFKLSSEDTKQVVIYPGVDLQKFKPPVNRKIHTPIRLLYVGRVIRQKGLHILLQSLPLLSGRGLNVHLTIIGRTPPWEANYGKFVRTLSHKLPVHWKGFVPPHELLKYYQRADVFICPSQRNEAFGLVNVEAMATGLPVIASKVGGMTESVTSLCGLVVDKYQTPGGFAEAIASLAKNEALWKTKTQAAQIRAEQFSWKHTAEQFNNLYQTLHGMGKAIR